MSRSSAAAITRIGWRTIVRSRGRSFLIVLLILLPVAAMAAAITLVATVSPTGEESATHRMGTADYEIQPGINTTTELIRAQLPDGAVIEPWSYSTVDLVLPGRTVQVVGASMDLNGLARGKLVITDGRSPSHPSEVAISAGVASVAGVGLNGEIELAGSGRLAVVGLVEDQFELNARLLLLDPSIARAAAADATTAESGGTALWLAEVPDDAVLGAECLDGGMGEQGAGCDLYVYSREFASQPSADVTFVIIVFGGLALVEAVLVAAAAFAVSVRRRQRELGLLAAAGAERRHLAGTVLGEAMLLGGIAAVIGVALGFGGIVAASPILDQAFNRRVGAVDVNIIYLLVAGAVGIIACLIAAALPAWAAARLPVLVALSGRRPPHAAAHRLLLVGAALIALGALLTSTGAALRLTNTTAVSAAVMLAGAILGVLGFGACSPWLIERLERLGLRLPPAGRIALRDVARARSRNAPIVTAILAAFAATVAFSAYAANVDAINALNWRPSLRADQLIISGPNAATAGPAAAAQLGAMAAGPVDILGFGDGDEIFAVVQDRSLPLAERDVAYEISVGDVNVLSALGGESAQRVFEGGGLVLFDSGADDRDELTIVFLDVETGREVEAHDVPAAVVRTGVFEGGPVRALVSRELADRLGATSSEGVARYVIRLPRAVTEADVAVGGAIAADDGRTFAHADLGPPQPGQVVRLAIIVLSMLFALSVTGIAVALGEAESRSDQRTLLAIGADPGIRRRIAAARAGVVTLMAGLLAVPAGLLPAWGLLANRGGFLVVPVPEIVAAIAILPLAGFVGGLLLTRRIPAWSALREAGS